MPEDVFARASYVLSAKVLDPQFQGQIKERLNSRDAVRLVSSFVRPALELWLNQHVDYGKKLAELAIKAAQTRQKAGQKVEKRKSSGVAVLPGKLTDCESRDIAVQRGVSGRGRLRRWQRQDGPRQGKPGHPAAARQGAQHLGGGPRPPVCQHRNPRHLGRHWRRPARPERHARPERPALRQGLHPERTPMWTVRTSRCCCSRCSSGTFPSSSRAGHVFVARPPLFRVDIPARGKKPAAKQYALDEGELHAILDKCAKDGVRAGKVPDQPLQGPGRDERRAIVGHHPQPRHATPHARGARGRGIELRRIPKPSSPSSWARARPPRAVS